ncbi:MAG: FG-GAP repeat protein, partial [Candidatus Paceibacterota bacterium]
MSGIKNIIIIFLSLLTTALFSQNTIKFIEKIVPKDRQANDQFGWSIDSDSKFLIAGVPNSTYWKNNKEVNGSGAVYVYKIENEKIVFFQKLFAPIPKKESSFGNTVALHKNVLVIGSYRYRKNGQTRYQTLGGIYIYRLINDKWEFEQFFKNPNEANKNNGRFGAKLDIYGNYIIAGDGLFNSSLSLIKYQNGHWKVTDMIINKDTTFGCDVTIYNKTIVVGSKNYTNNKNEVNQKGKVYIYTIDSNDKLQLQNTITPIAGDEEDLGFGSKVKLESNLLLIGAETTYPLKRNGLLFIYKDMGGYEYKLDTVIKAIQPLKEDWYAHSFDLFKNILVVGAMGNTMYDNSMVEYMGAVYIYEKIGKEWSLVNKEYAIKPTSWDKYGFFVSIHDSN